MRGRRPRKAVGGWEAGESYPTAEHLKQIIALGLQQHAFAAEHEAGEALEKWIQRYVEFIGAKRGLAAALHSGDPAYEVLPAYFDERLRPALTALLEAAAEAGAIRAGVDPNDLLHAVAQLATPAHDGDLAPARRMVALLVDGLRYGASSPAN